MESDKIKNGPLTKPENGLKGVAHRPSQKNRFSHFLGCCKKFWSDLKHKPHKLRHHQSQGRNKIDESFSMPEVCEVQLVEKTKQVDRLLHFGRDKGNFHSTWDRTSVTDLKIIKIETSIRVETVTDILTGKSVRADLSEYKVPKFDLSLNSMVTLAEMSLYSSLPYNRLHKLFTTSDSPLHPSKIDRSHQYLAQLGLGPYLALVDQLSDAKLLSGDDMPAYVLETEGKDHNEVRSGQGLLVREVEEKIGHTHARADGKGNKKAVNISLLVGRIYENEPFSTIVFYRTHRGHFGDLLEKVLEYRLPKSGTLLVQSDLSQSNSSCFKKFEDKFPITQGGCGSHARRGFYRNREEDEELCYYILRAFALLAHIEAKLEFKEASKDEILRVRQKNAKKVWYIILKECHWVVNGSPPGKGRRKWPPRSKIHMACKYIVKHQKELTAYLWNAEFSFTNNLQERLLRPEKLMTNNSKFRKSEEGRVTFDILRTLAQTSRAIGVSFRDYMHWLQKNEKYLQEDGALYTPYEFKKLLDLKSTSALSVA